MAANGQALDLSQELVKAFVERNEIHKANPGARAVICDAEGQVALAVSKPEWYNRWGMNYVSSLLSAHRQQRCNNFKDLGVADYGGHLFRVLSPFEAF